jgi:hypothetical protein
MKGLVSFTSHDTRSWSAVAISKWESKRLEDKTEKRWDLACTAAPSFICTASGSMKGLVSFTSREKDAFLFQSPTHSRREIEEPKRLGVQNILKSAASERRNPGSMNKTYQADWHSHLPKA